MEPTTIFLAGPFFDPAQIQLLERIEQCIRRHSDQYLLKSPREIHYDSMGDEKIKADIETRDDALTVLAQDIQWIKQSDIVIAVLDWLMPPRQEVHVVEWAEPEDGDVVAQPRLKTGPLNIPDTGTAWELGYCFALHKPTYIFTMNPITHRRKINVMLAASANGIIYGVDKLEEYLRYGFENVPKYAGPFF